MKVAVSSTGTGLDDQVDPRFGRCPVVLVVETESMAVEPLINTGVGSAHGAGVGAAQIVASKGIKTLLTGSVGPNAYSALTATGVKVYTGVSGSVRDAVGRFLRGELPQTTGPTMGGHQGMGGARGFGHGRGGRRF